MNQKRSKNNLKSQDKQINGIAQISYYIPKDEFRSFVRGFGLIPQSRQKEFIEAACIILGKPGKPISSKQFHVRKRGEAKTPFKDAVKLVKLAKKYGVSPKKFFDKTNHHNSK